MSVWNPCAKLCGNCRSWPLDDYSQRSWDRGQPGSGLGGRPSGHNGDQGECRRHAPVAVREPMYGGSGPPMHTVAYFPPVSSEHWCGDFELRLGYGSAPTPDIYSAATKATARAAKAEPQ
jgi:hypothetical protein